MPANADPIITARLALEPLDAATLVAFEQRTRAPRPTTFTWPSWWPDATDAPHVALWKRRAASFDGRDHWRPRAVVDRETSMMVGHAGFHLLPRPLDEALADPTYEGTRDPTAGGVVEIGYTIFSDARRRGYASEAVAALLAFASETGEVSAVLAVIEEDNAASFGVIERVGGFHRIGVCRDGDAVEIVLRRDLAP